MTHLKNVFFHIGFPKTGTSALQAFCINNNKFLRDHGVYYPIYADVKSSSEQTVGLSHDRWSPGMYHHYLLHKNEKGNLVFNEKLPYYEKILVDFEESECNNLLISSEDFVYADESYICELHKYFSGYHCKIICYVREIDSALESEYLEHMKNLCGNSVSSFEEFVSKTFSWFANRDSIVLNKWSDKFGIENCEFRLYDRSIMVDGDTISDFFDVLDISEKVSSPKIANPSLHKKYAALLELIGETYPELNKINSDDFVFRQKSIVTPLMSLKNGLQTEEQVIGRIIDQLNFRFPERSLLANELVQAVSNDRVLITDDLRKRLYAASKFSAKEISAKMTNQEKITFLSHYGRVIREQIKKIEQSNDVLNTLIEKVLNENWNDFLSWWFEVKIISYSASEWIMDYSVTSMHQLEIDCKKFVAPTPLMLLLWSQSEYLKSIFSKPLSTDRLNYWVWWIKNAEEYFGVKDIFPVNILSFSDVEVGCLSDIFNEIEDISGVDFVFWWNTFGIKKYVLGQPSRTIQNLHHSDFSNSNYFSKLMLTLIALRPDLQMLSLENPTEMWKWWLARASSEYSIDSSLPIIFASEIDEERNMAVLIEAVWSHRKDLQGLFPEPSKENFMSFKSWWTQYGYYEYNKSF